MDRYHVALFIHILALLAAVSASTLLHFSFGRLLRARDAAEAAQWFGLIGRTTKIFPAALLTFFVTGGYMVERTWTWRIGWVEGGVLGALILLVNGIVMGVRSRPLLGILQRAGSGAIPAEASAIMHDPVVHTLPWVNTLLAYGIVFVMVTKPGLTGALTELVLAVAAGLVVAARTRVPAAAMSTAQATAETA